MSSDTPDFHDSDLMNHALRMVIPMRREFGRALDVPSFLHNLDYAKEVLDQARTSQNPRLLVCADYLNSKLFGPRAASQLPTAESQPPASRAGATPPATDGPKERAADLNVEEEAKQLMMAKYRAGLR